MDPGVELPPPEAALGLTFPGAARLFQAGKPFPLLASVTPASDSSVCLPVPMTLCLILAVLMGARRGLVVVLEKPILISSRVPRAVMAWGGGLPPGL